VALVDVQPQVAGRAQHAARKLVEEKKKAAKETRRPVESRESSLRRERDGSRGKWKDGTGRLEKKGVGPVKEPAWDEEWPGIWPSVCGSTTLLSQRDSSWEPWRAEEVCSVQTGCMGMGTWEVCTLQPSCNGGLGNKEVTNATPALAMLQLGAPFQGSDRGPSARR
jgi:hypothetical protein